MLGTTEEAKSGKQDGNRKQGQEMGIVQKVTWAEMRQLEILFKNIMRDAMGIAVIMLTN